MRDTIDAVDTSVMEAAFEAFLQKIEAELNQLNAGTSAMMRATYDPQGRQTDIFKAIDKVSNIYYATLTLGRWTACSSARPGQRSAVPADGYADLREQPCAGGDGCQRVFVRHRLRQDRGARYR